MPHKSKKTKKKDVCTRKQNSETEKSEKCKNVAKGLNLKRTENFTIYFNHDELQEIKNVIKSKDLSNLPLISAAVIVNKFHIVEDLVQKGCHINETGQNHLTALMWAVKCKKIQIIDFLLANGADPTIKSDSGDNILFVALENKLWEEEDYKTLWNRVKNVSFVDVDFMSKTGLNMVHATIRREWADMLQILIAGKANINAENANGMTPLMLASYLNNFNLVDALLKAKADVMKEDTNGCMALCYAISSAINKNVKSPFLVVDKLLAELRNHEFNFKNFFESRIDPILHSTVKINRGRQPVVDTKTFIIHYVFRYGTESTLKTVLEMDIYRRIAQVAENYIHESLQMVKFLVIINEIMSYCDRCFGSGGLEEMLLGAFVVNGVADICLTVLKMYGFDNKYEYDFITTAFGPLLTVSVSHPRGKSWLNHNIFELLPFHKAYLKINPIQKNSNDIQTIRHNEKILEFNKLINTIREEREFTEIAQPEALELEDLHQEPSAKPEVALSNDNPVKENKQEPKSNPKKTKRRAKALKATIAKIKNADLAERFNQNGKKILEQKCISETSIVKQAIKPEEPEVVVEEIEEITFEQWLGQNEIPEVIEDDEIQNSRFKPWSKHSVWEQVWFVDNSNAPLADEFIQTITILESHLMIDLIDDLFNINFEQKPEHANEPNMEFEKREIVENRDLLVSCPDWSYTCTYKMKNENKRSIEFPKSIDNINLKEKPSDEEIKDLLTYTLNYLSGLLKKIIITYQKHWEQDREREDAFMNDHGDVTDHYEKRSNISVTIEKLGKENIQYVQQQFDKLIKRIKNCADTNFEVCSKIIDKLEGILLNHKIRGKSIIQDTVMQVVNINDDLDEALSNFYETDQDMSVPKSVENLLSQTRSEHSVDDIPCTEKFETHLQKHPDALYLEEILAVPPKAPPNVEKLRRDKIKTMKNSYHLVPSILNMCEENDDLITTETKQEANTSKYRKRQTLQETLSAMPKIDDPNKLLEVLETNHCNSEYPSLVEHSTSRWCNTVRSLQMMKCYQILLNGEIRISNKEKDDTHTISSGGNFSPVILGLDATDRPLAVKRIRKDKLVCKIMKNLLNPLLGLRNTNLLHYFSCNYEENELVLATPLCEYNMGEYIMLMKQSPNLHITSIDIVKQFLAGLRFLHDRAEPIIHGNLKPSNIFIDLNGIVRIAEFGMHKALYTLIEAPNTSIIWFSRETFVTFKETACIMCNCASDVQVAGMLIHFMLTAGKHPYGEIMQDILRNLERAIPQLATTDVDLHDLISWMLLYEPSERPSINQVLSHVFFWTIDRKWRFILTCSGVSSHGTPLSIPLNELHFYINIVAARENIKGRWINIMKAKFPNLSYSKDDQDSITGLLRFIRKCMQNQVALHINSDLEFRNFVLSSFPALPLSLYRILECSQWLNHRALQPFTTVDSLSA